ERAGIFGHSMGGHGALTLALRHPGRYRSVSAFAPIAAPTRCPWGEKAFSGYLGDDRSQWAEYDASELMAKASSPFPEGILIDQGLADNFLELQLYPEAFEAACQQAGQPLTLRRHEGYDHGYYFISTFMDSHLEFHARQLKKSVSREVGQRAVGARQERIKDPVRARPRSCCTLFSGNLLAGSPSNGY